MNIIDIENVSQHQNVPETEQIIKIIESGLNYLNIEAELSVRFVDEAESAQLNAHYRHKNSPTNVLSFPAEDDFPEENIVHMGDIVICPAVVEQEARLQGIQLDQHYAHLLIHGVLHLQGYDHIEEDDALVMETLEREILETLGFKNPYEEER